MTQIRLWTSNGGVIYMLSVPDVDEFIEGLHEALLLSRPFQNFQEFWVSPGTLEPVDAPLWLNVNDIVRIQA